MRPWSGILVVEGEQTGDGRFIAPGAIEWSDLPLPLGWLQEEMHSFPQGGVQIGIIETIERRGDEIYATGQIDDESEEGAELCRRMDGGTAGHGAESYVSIDPDDYEVEIVATEAAEGEDIIIIASAERRTWVHLRAFQLRTPNVTAAAGDGDPSDDGEVLFEDSVDEIVERYTRLRIRGATVCAIPAFDRAIIALDGAASEAAEPAEVIEAAAALPNGVSSGPTVGTVRVEIEPRWNGRRLDMVASGPGGSEIVVASSFPVAPPAEWFENPNLEGPTPLTITPEGRIFGHAAIWGTCHIGVDGVCREAPTSQSDYAYYRTGAVEPCDDGCDPVATGVLTMNTGHAATDRGLSYRQAAAHYDDTGTAVADLAMGEDLHGIWYSGALRPDVTDEQVRTLRASGVSGDWRSIGGHLEMVALLAVNVAGFPVPRAEVAGGQQVALVAAGARALAQESDPERLWRDDMDRRMQYVERITFPLRSQAIAALAAEVGRPGPAAVNA